MLTRLEAIPIQTITADCIRIIQNRYIRCDCFWSILCQEYTPKWIQLHSVIYFCLLHASGYFYVRVKNTHF